MAKRAANSRKRAKFGGIFENKLRRISRLGRFNSQEYSLQANAGYVLLKVDAHRQMRPNPTTRGPATRNPGSRLPDCAGTSPRSVRATSPDARSLRGDLALGLALFLAQTFELRLQAAAQPAIDAVEVEIDHRGDVEREQLREAQPADHRDAERLAQLRTLAGPERDRHRDAGRHRQEERLHDDRLRDRAPPFRRPGRCGGARSRSRSS